MEDVLAGEFADVGFEGNEVVEADGAGGLIEGWGCVLSLWV